LRVTSFSNLILVLNTHTHTHTNIYIKQ